MMLQDLIHFAMNTTTHVRCGIMVKVNMPIKTKKMF